MLILEEKDKERQVKQIVRPGSINCHCKNMCQCSRKETEEKQGEVGNVNLEVRDLVDLYPVEQNFRNTIIEQQLLCTSQALFLPSEVLIRGLFSPWSAEDTHVIRKECQETNINVIVKGNLFQLP